MNVRTALFLLLTLCASQMAAQELVVSKSPVSPDTTHMLSGEVLEQPLLALRLEAIGGNVTVEGFEFEVTGTGSPTTQMTDLSVWLDDGDGEFDAQLDTELWSGPSAAAVSVALAPTVFVGEGLFADVWVVASFAPDAGSSLGLTYSVGIADTSDVSVDGSPTVTFDPVPPQSTELALVLFRVDKVSHPRCGTIIIEGSGFTPPLEVYLTSLRLHGIFDINADHSRVEFRYELPSLLPRGVPTLDLSTALVTRYRTTGAIDLAGKCGFVDRRVDDSCTAAATPNRIPAILLLAALMFAGAGLKVRRQP